MIAQASLIFWTLVLAWFGLIVYRLVYNVFFHPLRSYPGPMPAKATTWWKTYIEVVKGESWTDVLIRLHKQYGMYTRLLVRSSTNEAVGDVLRVGPNEVSTSKRNPDFAD